MSRAAGDEAAQRAAKRPKLLEEDLVWRPAGDKVNLIEAGGKSCTHEVRGGGCGGGGCVAVNARDERCSCRPGCPCAFAAAERHLQPNFNTPHQVVWPLLEADGGKGAPAPDERSLLPPAAHKGPPARTYPFPLDPFQQTAINCLEAGGWLRAWCICIDW
jgi:hypothetical protein